MTSFMDDGREALLQWYKPGVEVTCYAVEASTTNHVNRAVDNNFKIELCYKDTTCPSGRITRIELARGSDWPDMQCAAIKCLEQVDADGNAYDGAIDSVVFACEKLVQQVSTLGRTSLAMVVTVDVEEDVLELHREDEGYTDFMEDDTRDGEEDEPEEVVMEEAAEGEVTEEEEKMRRCLEARNWLWQNGVKFISGDQVGMIDGEIGCCSICLVDFDEDNGGKFDEVAFLPCSHVLHGDCLVSWILEEKVTCPLCRSKLLLY